MLALAVRRWGHVQKFVSEHPWWNTALLLRSTAQTLPRRLIQGLMMFDWSIIQSQVRTFIPPFLEFKYSFESDISPTLWGNPAVSLSLGTPSFICNAVISLSDNSTECVVFKGRRQREHGMVLGGWKWGIDIQSSRHSSSSSAVRIRIWSSVFVSHPCQLRVAGVANVSTWYLETTRTK